MVAASDKLLSQSFSSSDALNLRKRFVLDMRSSYKHSERIFDSLSFIMEPDLNPF